MARSKRIHYAEQGGKPVCGVNPHICYSATTSDHVNCKRCLRSVVSLPRTGGVINARIKETPTWA